MYDLLIRSCNPISPHLLAPRSKIFESRTPNSLNRGRHATVWASGRTISIIGTFHLSGQLGDRKVRTLTTHSFRVSIRVTPIGIHGGQIGVGGRFLLELSRFLLSEILLHCLLYYYLTIHPSANASGQVNRHLCLALRSFLAFILSHAVCRNRA